MLSHFVRELILPPGCLLIAAVVGLALINKRPKWGKGLLIGSLSILYLLSIPPVSARLTKTTETRPALSLDQIRAFPPQALVILGTGVDFRAPEFGGQTVAGAETQKRVAYGAYLAQQLDLPVIVTGGYGETKQDSEAFAMAKHLENWGVEDVFLEDKSQNTQENAQFSKAIAERENIARVVVVSSANHMARAEGAFIKAGFEVLVAPTGFRSAQPWERGILLLTPSHGQFDQSCRALRVHLAQLWYRLRY